MLALCCHHRCEWRSYVGKALMAQWGISARQFHLMCCLSSWAVCGSRPDKGGQSWGSLWATLYTTLVHPYARYHIKRTLNINIIICVQVVEVLSFQLEPFQTEPVSMVTN